MTSREAQAVVEEFYAFAVSRKIRGEGRFAVHPDTRSLDRLGVGETRAQAWKDAALAVLRMAKQRMAEEEA